MDHSCTHEQPAAPSPVFPAKHEGRRVNLQDSPVLAMSVPHMRLLCSHCPEAFRLPFCVTEAGLARHSCSACSSRRWGSWTQRGRAEAARHGRYSWHGPVGTASGWKRLGVSDAINHVRGSTGQIMQSHLAPSHSLIPTSRSLVSSVAAGEAVFGRGGLCCLNAPCTKRLYGLGHSNRHPFHASLCLANGKGNTIGTLGARRCIRGRTGQRERLPRRQITRGCLC